MHTEVFFGHVTFGTAQLLRNIRSKGEVGGNSSETKGKRDSLERKVASDKMIRGHRGGLLKRISGGKRQLSSVLTQPSMCRKFRREMDNSKRRVAHLLHLFM